MKKFTSDIDIDFKNREEILKLVSHTPASISRDDKLVQHNTGVYVTDIPVDPFKGISSIDYVTAEERGYVKLDFLNVGLYSHVRDEQHLDSLLKMEPDWGRLQDRNFCSQLIHIGNHYDTLIRMPEPVNSIPRMAMFLSVIRPAKRHLIGQTWQTVAKTVWQADPDGGYQFKKSHSLAYAHLVVVHMNLITLNEIK